MYKYEVKMYIHINWSMLLFKKIIWDLKKNSYEENANGMR